MKRTIGLVLTAILLLGIFFGTCLTVSADTLLKVSDECIDILKAYEGFCKYPYWDYGQWTVGYGTRCPADKLDTYKANGITEEEAEELLRVFVADYEEDLHYFISKYSLNTTQNQFDAMFLMSYNCGSGWIYSTSGNFHKAMADPNTDPAMVLYQFGTWSNAGDSPMVGLIKRRLAEANMYLNGVYSKNRPTNYCYVIYESNGGAIEDCVHAYDVNMGAVAPITPVLTGYLFEGWFTAQVGGTQVTSLDASTDGKTLYARWVSDGSNPELPPDAPADQTVTKLESPVEVKVTADELNLRKGPGTNYAPLTYVVAGDAITVTALSTDETGRLWGYTDKGWACLEFTDYAQVVGGQTPPQPETPTEPAPSAPKGEAGTVIANGALNIRKEPDASSALVGEYPTKTRILILEQKGNWGRTDKGWVSMDYVRLDGKKEYQQDAIAKGMGARIVYKGGDKSYGISGSFQVPSQSILDLVLSGANAWGNTSQGANTLDQSANQETALPKAEKTGTVCVKDTLNIRTGAGTDCQVVGVYHNGEKVTILDSTVIGAAHWGRTDRGWINLAFVTMDGAREDGQRTVTASSLNIRQSTDMNATVVGTLKAGDLVAILETKLVDDALWGRIQQGWIALAYTE